MMVLTFSFFLLSPSKEERLWWVLEEDEKEEEEEKEDEKGNDRESEMEIRSSHCHQAFALLPLVHLE